MLTNHIMNHRAHMLSNVEPLSACLPFGMGLASEIAYHLTRKPKARTDWH